MEATRTAAAMCGGILWKYAKKAVNGFSNQTRVSQCLNGGKIKLTEVEQLEWVFVQPGVDVLTADSRVAKRAMMLMLQVTGLIIGAVL